MLPIEEVQDVVHELMDEQMSIIDDDIFNAYDRLHLELRRYLEQFP